MANKKTIVDNESVSNKKEEIVDNIEVVTTPKAKREIKGTDRVVISNNRNWNLNFVSTEPPYYDITIPAGVKHWKKLTVAEVEGQIQIDNSFFVGRDGRGNNAAIEIEDKDIRDYLFHTEGDEGDGIIVLNLKSVKELLAIENKNDFEKRLAKLVVSDSDKKMIVPLAIEAGIDDVASYKISKIEKISGYKF